MTLYRYDGPDERHYPFIPDGENFLSLVVKPGDTHDLAEAPDGWWHEATKPSPKTPPSEPAEPAGSSISAEAQE